MSRHRSGEALIFGIATVLILVHRLDDAFVHRGRGVGQDTLAAAIAIAAALTIALAFPSLGPGLRAARLRIEVESPRSETT
jgi:hypothetical protein